MVQNYFASGIGGLFINLYLAFESFGCVALTSIETAQCESTINGNWMLGFNSCFIVSLYQADFDTSYVNVGAL